MLEEGKGLSGQTTKKNNFFLQFPLTKLKINYIIYRVTKVEWTTGNM